MSAYGPYSYNISADGLTTVCGRPIGSELYSNRSSRHSLGQGFIFRSGKMPVRVVESSTPSNVSGTNDGQTAPPPRSLLSVGKAFSGTQNVSSLQKDEAWRVNVCIQGCDLVHGYLCGTMEALNVPMADTPVVTFWEGEIVDTKNYTFYRGKWQAMPEDEIRHWSKFPSLSPLLKEHCFVNVGTDCGLTIAVMTPSMDSITIPIAACGLGEREPNLADAFIGKDFYGLDNLQY
ncbi:Vacuolar import/degradation protein Vid24 [Dillenia turbinata]|uniref:Vacuolar import/degradation protein Vid24 n=1 Tax=Dillenia turbinata TaxID=194707 RepID=A0AAN8W4B1_9MAGN